MSDRSHNDGGPSSTLTRDRRDEQPEATSRGATPRGGEAAASSGAVPDAAPARSHVSGGNALTRQLRIAAAQLRRTIAGLTVAVTAVIALGIVFRVLGANEGKWLVANVEDLARWLASPFDQMFTPHSPKLAVAVNWGIAIGVYALIGRALSRLAARAARER